MSRNNKQKQRLTNIYSILSMVIFLFFGCQETKSKKINIENIKFAKPKIESQIKKLNKKDTSSLMQITTRNEKGISKQNTHFFNIDKIKYRGISLKSNKEKILELMGKPDSIVEPNYECGFHSTEEQGIKFYQYYYGNMNFILSDKGADVEKIYFDTTQEIQINGLEVNYKTTFDEVINLLGLKLKNNSDKSFLIIHPEGGYDEHYELDFQDKKLTQFTIWTPC